MAGPRVPSEPFPGADGSGVTPGDETVESEPLDLDGAQASADDGAGSATDVEVEPVDEDGAEDGDRSGATVIRQQNVGPGNEFGSGEYPDRDAAPQSPAPGAGRSV